jgi:dTDP-4-dehydrorhamnose reductase
MKVLILGASGQVGACLMEMGRRCRFEMVGTYCAHAQAGLLKLDATDRAATLSLARDIRPDWIVHCAAWAWVDGNEQDPARAFRENVDAVANAAHAAGESDARFCLLSTSYVFDGRKPEPYTEDDPTSPVNVYGETKLAAELLTIRTFGDRALILRTICVYGPDPQAKNFAYTVIAAGRAGRPLLVPSDQRGNPTFGPDLALAALALMERRAEGMWNVAGPEASLDRAVFANAICAAAGIAPGFLRPVPTADLQQPASRPLNAGLDISRLREAGIRMRPLADALDAWCRGSYRWSRP